MDDLLISAWGVGSNSRSTEMSTPTIATAQPKELIERVGVYRVTYDLPAEEDLKKDGGRAAFRAGSKRDPRQPGRKRASSEVRPTSA